VVGSSFALFILMLVFYGAAAVLHVGFLRFRHWYRAAVWVTRFAWIAQTVALVLRVVETGRPPFLSLVESAVFFSWVLILHYLLLEYLVNLKITGVFLAPANFVLLVVLAVLPRGSAEMNPFLLGNWVTFHVLVAFLGYAAFALSCLAAGMYLIQEKQLREKKFWVFYYLLPSLETLDRVSYYLIGAGFPLLTLAILAGSFWAGRVWGSHWSWDPKEIWSLVTWTIYGFYLLTRVLAGWRGRKPALLSLAGFSAVVFNYVVVNLYITDWHRYHF